MMFHFDGGCNILLIMACLQTVCCSKGPKTPAELAGTVLRLNMALEIRMHHLDFYIRNMERSLKNILLETSLKTTKEDRTSVSVVALTMVRRLTTDWTALAGMMRGLSSDSLTHSLGVVRWPIGEDLEAVTKAVARSQLIYGLDTEILAQGSLNNITFFADINAMDGFNIAKAHMKKHHYGEAAGWLQYCLRRISGGDHSASHHSLLQHLAISLCYSGKTEECRSLLTEVVTEYPDGKTPEDLIIQYFNASMKDYNTLMDAANHLKRLDDFGMELKENVIETHRRLCRGVAKVDGKLQCRYVHYQQPHLRFQPFKLEELQVDPPVLRFYDAITDMEAEALKKDSLKKMEPSRVFGVGGKVITSDYRSSFLAWLNTGDSEVGDRLTYRMCDMTRMNAFYADVHQVSSYALSGGYEPHHDFLENPFQYDRVATLMYYLTEVKQGGNTVFLNWNLSVPPVKNSAILWFNFLPNGQVDDNTYHSGCPVLQGQKWVLNKWIWNWGGIPCVGNHARSYMDYYIE